MPSASDSRMTDDCSCWLLVPVFLLGAGGRFHFVSRLLVPSTYVDGRSIRGQVNYLLKCIPVRYNRAHPAALQRQGIEAHLIRFASTVGTKFYWLHFENKLQKSSGISDRAAI